MSGHVSVTLLHVTLFHCSCLCNNVSVTLQSVHRPTRGWDLWSSGRGKAQGSGVRIECLAFCTSLVVSDDPTSLLETGTDTPQSLRVAGRTAKGLMVPSLDSDQL